MVNFVRKISGACMETIKSLSDDVDQKQAFCSREIDDLFSPIIDHLYAKKYLTDDIKRVVTKIVDNLKLSAHKMIDANKDWLDISKDENNNPRKIWSGLSDDKPVQHTPSEHAHEKVSKMTLYLGGFDAILNENSLDDLYKNHIAKLEKDVGELNAIPTGSEADFKTKYEVIKNDAINYKGRITFEVVRKGNAPDGSKRTFSVNSRSKTTKTTTVNGQYMPELNGIFVPTAILQPPFFSVNYPDAINYGRIGSILSHELTHAFDSKGSMYDANGDYIDPNSNAKADAENPPPYDETKKHAWMSKKAREEFDKKDQKLQKVYSKQPLNYHCAFFWDKINSRYIKRDNLCPTKSIDGELTSAENIADQGGIRISYDAFVSLKDSERSPPENELSLGMLKTFGIKSELKSKEDNVLVRRQKLFFASFGSINCDMLTAKSSVTKLIATYIDGKDFHASNYLRVNTVLANYNEFSSLYDCSSTAHTMIPLIKRTVWKLDTLNK